MLRSRQPPRGTRRGAATVEFALVVPLLVSILMFSMYLLDIVRAKFKVQEASRYVAWEMSSYTLSDYGQGNHEQAFDVAKQASEKEANERFADLDSVEPTSRFGFMLRAEPAKVTVKNQTVDGIDLSRVFPSGSGGGGAEAAAAVGQSLNYFLNHFKMNTKGRVEVEIGSTLSSSLLPRGYLQKEDGFFYSVDNWGGRDLSNMPVKNRFTLIANGWHLPDGGDAVMRPKQAGMHTGGSPHGLRLQVDRMKFLGVGNYFDQVGLDQLGSVANFIFPDFLGPFVVAHNYVPSASGRDCNKGTHGASMGLNNLNAYPGMDDAEQRCFDTAPFRDTQTYDNSLYRQMFMARGGNFMGCKNSQADMPNTPNLDPSASKDKNEQKITCE